MDGGERESLIINVRNKRERYRLLRHQNLGALTCQGVSLLPYQLIICRTQRIPCSEPPALSVSHP